MGLSDLWGQLIDCICRPPRDVYKQEDLVGGVRGNFKVGHFKGRREDVTLTNKKGLKLQCSHFIPVDARGRDGKGLPCVIYCHCNSGSRRDAEEAVYILLPLGVSVFTLDFAGSGLSEGQYVTLGANEVDDVEVAVAHLRSTGAVSTLGLWGRSMGAVTALLYSQRDPSIAGVVVDSPFSRLTDLMLEIVEEQKLPIPKPFFKMAVAAMKRSVRKKAGFELDKVAPIEVVPESFIPALFGHATEDTFIRISHSEKLHAAYAGDKNLIRFAGDHNSRRPEFFYSSVSVFFHNTLQLDEVLEGGNRLDREVRRVLEGAGPAESASAHSAAAVAHSAEAQHTLDAWGDRARADIRRVISEEQGGTHAEDGEEDPEDDAALMAAIQMSLLESAQQRHQQAQPGESGVPGQGHQGEGAGPHGQPVASDATALQGPPLDANGTTSTSHSAPDPVQHSRGQSYVPDASGLGVALLSEVCPLSAEEEEAMLAEAIRLSLNETSSQSGQAAAAAVPCTVFPGLAEPAQAPAAAQHVQPRQAVPSYVDQLCEALGPGLSAPEDAKPPGQPK